MISLQIKQISEQYIPQIVDLLNENLPFGLANKEIISQYLHSPYALCALDKQMVIGFISSADLLNSQKEFLNHQDIVVKLKKLNSQKPITIKQLVVNKDYRSKRIGSILQSNLLGNFETSSFITTGWITHEGWNAESIFTKQGFQILLNKKLFWYKDSILKEYGCPYCPKGCSCSSIICYKKTQ